MEIEYSHGFEKREETRKTTVEEKVYFKIFGRGILIGFSIMFFSCFGIFISEIITMIGFFAGAAVVCVCGCIYDYHGGHDAESSGKRLIKIKKIEYFDFLDTKTGKVRRLFVNVATGESGGKDE